MGTASGLVGAGGNIGAALFNVLLSGYVGQMRTAFLIMGGLALGLGVGGTFFLAFEGVWGLGLFRTR
jgi:MFS transporter, NNP family, nitrate/nitrite transporter